MDNEFVSYTQALALKELGFKKECFGYYDKDGDFYTVAVGKLLNAPLYQQAFRWFREKHKLWTYNIPYNTGKYCIEIWRLVEGDDYAKTKEDRVIMDSWEEAEQVCINRLIEIVKNKT